MKKTFTYYKSVSLLTLVVLISLVLIQVNWFQKLVVLKQDETHQELQKLIPSIALDINKIDSHIFHGEDLKLNQLPMTLIEDHIDSILNLNGIKSTFYFAIYQDSIHGVFKSNNPIYKEELIQSDIKSCISNIISFSFVTKKEREPNETDNDYFNRLTKGSKLFQHFGTFDHIRAASGKNLWLSIYLPNEISGTIRSLIYQFAISVLLLILLLCLLYFLIKSLTQYKKLSKVKNDFFNNMSHEFKVPLSSIRLASKVLRQSSNVTKNEIYHQIIEKESKRLEKEIDKLLELSLFDNAEAQLEAQQINLHEVIRDIPERLKLLIERKKAIIYLNLQLENSIIQGDLSHLSNCLCNLVENSLKYSDNEVKIWIDAYPENNKKVITVRDNGPGIAPIYQEQIFDRFFRAKKNNQYKTQGFGIGLSYVKTIIEAHNGTIAINKKHHNGCEFIIRL